LLGKKELLEKAKFWHQRIVKMSLFESNIDLDSILLDGKNLAGDTTSENEEEDEDYF